MGLLATLIRHSLAPTAFNYTIHMRTQSKLLHTALPQTLLHPSEVARLRHKADARQRVHIWRLTTQAWKSSLSLCVVLQNFRAKVLGLDT